MSFTQLQELDIHILMDMDICSFLCCRAVCHTLCALVDSLMKKVIHRDFGLVMLDLTVSKSQINTDGSVNWMLVYKEIWDVRKRLAPSSFPNDFRSVLRYLRRELGSKVTLNSRNEIRGMVRQKKLYEKYDEVWWDVLEQVMYCPNALGFNVLKKLLKYNVLDMKTIHFAYDFPQYVRLCCGMSKQYCHGYWRQVAKLVDGKPLLKKEVLSWINGSLLQVAV